jgi:hypothetical protein
LNFGVILLQDQDLAGFTVSQQESFVLSPDDEFRIISKAVAALTPSVKAVTRCGETFIL